VAIEREQISLEDSVDIVILGDALANDQDLRSAIPSIRTAIVNDSPGGSGKEARELLRRIWSNCVCPNYEKIRTTVLWAVECFTQSESKRIKAISEAKVNNAKANILNAQAAAIRANERRRDELLDYFKSRSIEMAAEQQEGILRIVFRRAEPDERQQST
jgi:hypothetical protein